MGKRPFFPREVAAGRVPPATLGISLVLYFEGDTGAGGLQGARDERHVVVLTLGHLACVALVEVRALSAGAARALHEYSSGVRWTALGGASAQPRLSPDTRS